MDNPHHPKSMLHEAIPPICPSDGKQKIFLHHEHFHTSGQRCPEFLVDSRKKLDIDGKIVFSISI